MTISRLSRSLNSITFDVCRCIWYFFIAIDEDKLAYIFLFD